MNADALELALRHVIETKRLVDSLIRSSESFDYSGAKRALQALEEKSRDLGKLAAKLNASAPPRPGNVIALPAAVGATGRP